MIATPVLNRAHDGSRGSRTTSPQETINKNATAHAPSPLADGGGAERSEAEGVFVHPTTTTEARPNNDTQTIPTLPEGKNLSRFLDAFLDGSFSIPSICDEFELTVYEVLALLESSEVQNALEALKKIANIRQDTIAAQARVTAIHRLSELATYAHTANATEARAFETARKSAAQIIRTTNPKRRPQDIATEPGCKFCDSASPPRERQEWRAGTLCVRAGLVNMQGRRRRDATCKEVGSEI